MLSSIFLLGVKAHICNPRTWVTEQKSQESKDTLSNTENSKPAGPACPLRPPLLLMFLLCFTCPISASSPDVYHVKHSNCSSWIRNLDRQEPDQHNWRCWRCAGQLRAVAGEVSHSAPEAWQCAAGFVSAFNAVGGMTRERASAHPVVAAFCSLATHGCLAHLCLYPVSFFFPHLSTAYFTVVVVIIIIVCKRLYGKKVNFWLKTFSYNKNSFKDHLSLSSDYPNSYLTEWFFKLFFLVVFCNYLWLFSCV